MSSHFSFGTFASARGLAIAHSADLADFGQLFLLYLVPVAYAEAPPSAGTYLDPTTRTPFPSTLTSPEGVKLQLVGTGVRTVSFLSIKVYAVGFYVSEKELEQAKGGKLEGWKVSSLTSAKLDDSFGIDSEIERTGIHT